MIDYNPVDETKVADIDSAAVNLVHEFVQAIRMVDLELGERVVVIGSGMRTELVAELVTISGGFVDLVDPSAVKNRAPRAADVLVYADANLRSFGPSLSLVRNLGRVLLMSGFDQLHLDLDIYPDLHKRSLRLVCAGRPAQGLPSVRAFALYLLRSGRLRVDTSSVTGGA